MAIGASRRAVSAGLLAMAVATRARAAPARPPVVLVHGAWHGAWCWREVAARLRSAGRRVVAVDLPGAGADMTPADQVSMDSYAAALEKALAAFDQPAVLVGHSMGGAPISLLAERAPGKVARLVYVSAFVPANGEKFLDLGARDKDSAVSAAIAGPPQNGALALDPAKAAGVFYNQCLPSVAAAAVKQLRPQPVRPLSEPITLSEARWGAVPKTYIRDGADRAVSPAFQDWMIARRPEMKVVRLDSDHSPFLSHPAELASRIAAV